MGVYVPSLEYGWPCAMNESGCVSWANESEMFVMCDEYWTNCVGAQAFSLSGPNLLVFVHLALQVSAAIF